MNVVVVGAGKMGLPLACQLARNGARVVACDKRASVVESINRGECPIDEPGIGELLRQSVSEGVLSASMDIREAAGGADVVIVIVPALLTAGKDADTSILEEVSFPISAGLRPGMLVSYETTLPVGGTRKLSGILERSGLRAGIDFDLVFSPERVKSQLVLSHLMNTPKIVGGITPGSAARGADFYGKYLGVPVINIGSLEAAELVKLAGMVYRDVNIALSNELARYAEAVGVDFQAIIEAANTDGEAALLRPGIGVGGHCTPVYPHFLIRDGERRGVRLDLTEAGRRSNDEQPGYTLDRLERVWGPVAGRRVLVLGLGFRPAVKEHAFSPAFGLRLELEKRGATMLLHDPLYSPEEIEERGFKPWSWQQRPMPVVMILNTAHSEYRGLEFAQLAAQGLEAVVDGRALWRPQEVRGAGLTYIGIGCPDYPSSISRSRAVPVARPILSGEEAAAASAVVRSGWVSQGPEVAAFESEFAVAVGARHACAVSSGTAALHLALLAVGVCPGDEVITASHSFVATANSVRYCGATPVFVDIEPGTFNMDPSKIEGLITERTRAILCIHQMGMPCDLQSILAIARARSLPIVEDAACAIGSEIFRDGSWERIGKPHGDIGCFSFHPRKLLTTGDGGMITTSNPEWDRQFRLWRQHSMSVPDTQRHSAHRVTLESYLQLGYNYRMTDIQAAVGRAQLRRLPAIIERRRLLADHYRVLLGTIPGIRLPEEPEWARSNWQSYCVRIPDGCDQRDVMQAVLDAGIATRRGVMCAHREPAYPRGTWSCGAGPRTCDCVPGTCARLSQSEQAQDRAVILPLYHQMTDAEQEAVAKALHEACVNASIHSGQQI